VMVETKRRPKASEVSRARLVVELDRAVVVIGT
jgi:hypothetical protein